MRAFTFDFEALYDSITPTLAIEAVKSAITECRPDWSDIFVEWICYLLTFSMESAVGVFKDNWYKPKKGIPIGGSCSVPLANIAVYYVLKKVLYSRENKMRNIVSMKRFIDDDTGLHTMSNREFDLWRKINESDVDKDEYVPGMHLYNNHNMRDFGDFNENYEMTLLEKCSPSMLDVKEHLWIQKLRTLNPLGLNSVDPFGLPLLV